MGALTVGRFGIDLAVDDVDAFRHDGDTVQFTGVVVGANATELRLIRQQITGLVDNVDEPVVPVTYSVDSDLDGYYHVEAATCEVGRAGLVNYWAPYSITLRRVWGYAAPVIEVRTIGADRTNSHAVSPVDWHAIPAAASGYSDSFANQAKATRDTESGNVTVYYDNAGAGHYYDAAPHYHVAPASYYNGACRIEVAAGYPVVGRQVRNAPTAWRLTNGCVRIMPGAAAGYYELEVWNGTAWENCTEFQIGAYSLGFTALGDPHSLTVLRNSPELCVVRFGLAATAAGIWTTDYMATIDLAIRRGAQHVEGYLSSTDNYNWSLFHNGAATAGTGYIRLTANNADGNRWLSGCTVARTDDLATGTWSTTAAAYEMAFFVGAELGGSGSSGIDTAANVAAQYYAAQGERQIVVAR